jgi:hypothetical protein
MMTEAEARANLEAAIIAFKLQVKFAEATTGSPEYMAYARATYDLWHAQRELERVRNVEKRKKGSTFAAMLKSGPLRVWCKVAAKSLGLFK